MYFLAFFGVRIGILLPFLGAVPFIAGLMVWYVPGVALSWTGFFRFHEFGAEPTGWVGHLLMFVFYAALALLLSWPFGRRRPPASSGSPSGPSAAPPPPPRRS